MSLPLQGMFRIRCSPSQEQGLCTEGLHFIHMCVCVSEAVEKHSIPAGSLNSKPSILGQAWHTVAVSVCLGFWRDFHKGLGSACMCP